MRRGKLKWFLLVGAVFLMSGLCTSLYAASKQEKVVKMKYDCYIINTAPTAALDTWLWDYVEKNSKGRIKIDRFYSSSLHKVGEHLPAVRNGLSELSLISYGYYPADVPISRGTEWYFRGCDHADTLLYVMRDLYAEFKPLRDEWEKKNNCKVLYFTNWDYCPLLMKASATSVSDLKGKKIRGYGIGSDTIQRLGGTGMPVVAGEVYTSLQRGILDGVFAFCFITAYHMKLHEQAPYVIEVGSGAHAPTAVVMNLNLWNSLDPELKAVFDAGVKEIYDHQYVDMYGKWIEECVDGMVVNGAKFSKWSDTEIAKAKAMVQPAQVNEWIEKVSPLSPAESKEMQALIDKLIAKYEPQAKLKLPYEVYLQKYGKK
jgi:TRAP-type C4-dicarboxylate transport system substrate-binding protein